MKQKHTGVFVKLGESAVNALIAILVSLPALWVFGVGIEWKLSVIAIFFLYNVSCEFHFGRCFGMIVFGAVYGTPKSVMRKIPYLILYTASFATLFFWVTFPFDLFMANLLFLQAPSILFTGTTFHGLVSGGVRTIHPFRL